MNSSQFNAILKRRLDLIQRVLDNKAVEYASDDDKFANMRLSAAITEVSLPKLCLSNFSKHLASVVRMVNGDPCSHTREQWDEKLGDAINYLILLEGIVAEMINAQTEPGNPVSDGAAGAGLPGTGEGVAAPSECDGSSLPRGAFPELRSVDDARVRFMEPGSRRSGKRV